MQWLIGTELSDIVPKLGRFYGIFDFLTSKITIICLFSKFPHRQSDFVMYGRKLHVIGYLEQKKVDRALGF